MKKPDALAALAALAQDNRLDVFRLLVEAGRNGMPAGAVADALKLAPNTLTFHFDRLRDAGLVTVRREGRSMIYAASLAAELQSPVAPQTDNRPWRCVPPVAGADAPPAMTAAASNPAANGRPRLHRTIATASASSGGARART